MRFPFRFSFHLQNASHEADSREEEALRLCLTPSPAPSTVSPLSAGWSQALQHSPAVPEPCSRAQPLLPAANSLGPRHILGTSQLPSTSVAVQWPPEP